MKKITFEFALAALTLFLLSGCGGSDTESDEQEELQSTYMSDFEWAVGQMEDVYDDYDVETGAWRLINASEIYVTSANEMNGADYAVTLTVEFAKKGPGEEQFSEGGSPGIPFCEKVSLFNMQDSMERKSGSAKLMNVQVASWDGNRQLDCLSQFKEEMANWASEK